MLINLGISPRCVATVNTLFINASTSLSVSNALSLFPSSIHVTWMFLDSLGDCLLVWLKISSPVENAFQAMGGVSPIFNHNWGNAMTAPKSYVHISRAFGASNVLRTISDYHCMHGGLFTIHPKVMEHTQFSKYFCRAQQWETDKWQSTVSFCIILYLIVYIECLFIKKMNFISCLWAFLIAVLYPAWGSIACFRTRTGRTENSTVCNNNRNMEDWKCNGL